MNMKKRTLASAITLALASGSVWAVTSTSDVKVIVDKTEVRAGEIVNLSIMGLNGKGEVDLKGEENGAILIATVKSKLGKVIGGSNHPGESIDTFINTGEFMSFHPSNVTDERSLKYIKLDHGVGRVHIVYPPDVQYQDDNGNPIPDEVTVLLQQRYALGTSQVQFDDISGIGVSPRNDCPSGVFEGMNACPYVAEPISIAIKPPSTDPGSLNIVAFLPAGAWTGDPKTHQYLVAQALDLGFDPKGGMDEYFDAEPNGIYDNEDGIQGMMTAGMRNGIVVVEAENSSINGLVRVTLTEVSDLMLRENGQYAVDRYVTAPQQYVFTDVPMIQGRAYLRLDDRVKKAGNYYIKAEFKVINAEGAEEYKYSSVDLVNRDILEVLPTGLASSVALVAYKDRVTTMPKPNAGVGGTPVVAQVLDEHGNATPLLNEWGTPTTGIGGAGLTLRVQDSSGIAAAFNLPVNLMTGETGVFWLGDQAGEITKVGTISLRASAALTDGRTILSNVEPIKVVNEWLTAEPQLELLGGPRAGEDFDSFKVMAWNAASAKVALGRIVIENASTKEKSTVRRNDATEVAEARFTKATIIGTREAEQDMRYKWFIVSDEEGKYAQVLYEAPTGIGTNAGVSVEFANAHSESLTQQQADGTIQTVVPSPKYVAKKHVLMLPEFGFKMRDCFGNPVTGMGNTDKVGTYRVASANADVKYNTPEGTFAVPYQDNIFPINSNPVQRTGTILTYPKTGQTQFSGDDQVAVRFTKAGLVAGPCKAAGDTNDKGADPFIITTTVQPFVSSTKKLAAYIEGDIQKDASGKDVVIKVPVHGEVPLAIESLVDDGVDKNGNPLFRPFADFENIRVEVTFNTMDNELGWKPDIREVLWVNGMLTEKSISNGTVLDLTTNEIKGGRNGRTVFAVYGGPVPRKPFSVTFTNVDNRAQSITRVLEITQDYQASVEKPGQCSATNPKACTEEVSCAGAGGVFIAKVGEQQPLMLGCNLVPMPVNIDKGNSASINKGGFQEFNLDQTLGIIFSAGVSINGSEFFLGPLKTFIGGNELLTFAGNIKVKASHVNKNASLLMVVGVEPPPELDYLGPYDYEGGTDTRYFAISGEGALFRVNLYAPQNPDPTWSAAQVSWTIAMDEMLEKPFKKNAKLKKDESVHLWTGRIAPHLNDLGTLLGFSTLTNARLYVFYGYVITEAGDPDMGTVFYNSQPIIITVK